jgi:hypothetical protein
MDGARSHINYGGTDRGGGTFSEVAAAIDEHRHRKWLAYAKWHLSIMNARETVAPSGLFSDHAWDMLLDLFVAMLESRAVAVSDACIVSSAPATTALRWLRRLEKHGLVERRADPRDRRRIFVSISSRGDSLVSAWLDRIMATAPRN